MSFSGSSIATDQRQLSHTQNDTAIYTYVHELAVQSHITYSVAVDITIAYLARKLMNLCFNFVESKRLSQNFTDGT